jgi:ATP adenylyltransferase
MLAPGTLWSLVQQRTAEALACGELKPIVTRSEFIRDAGVEFLVRVISGDKHQAPPHAGPGAKASPFLARDDALFVCDVSPTHVVRLNRYPVVEHHLLVVTRSYEEQEAPLNRGDFHALWTCLREYDSLGFYNGGAAAGASQSHKHLQVVSLPLVPGEPRIPILPLLEVEEISVLGRSSVLPFRHVLACVAPNVIEDTDRAAEATLRLYHLMLRSLGMNADATRVGPYNLLVTREWMLLVPRSRENVESISLNALAFAGALLVKTEDQLTILKQHGPIAALRAVVEESV